uniref:Protein VAC14 homolog n=1 Tax=Rhabditophanes sp. KR3021 TaxID=114890 RepID=A0AC35UAD0_9BILA
MNDSKCAPLTGALVKALTDKIFEKRKAAANDVEKQVREFMRIEAHNEIDRVIMVLRELTLNTNMHARAGGLIGIAAVAVALGKNSFQYTRTLIESVMPSFMDVEYQNVRSGADLLERLLKDIVKTTEGFNVEQVMVLIKERIYAEDAHSRRFVVSWLRHLIDIPGFNLINFVPDLIDGLFKMLGDGADIVKNTTEEVLAQLLQKIDKNSVCQIDISACIRVLVEYARAQGSNLVAKKMALVWLEKIISVSEPKTLVPHLPNFLVAVLPCLTPTDQKANAINKKLLEIDLEDNDLPIKIIVEVLLKHASHEHIETRVASLKWIHKLYLSVPAKLLTFMGQLFPKLLSSLTDPSDEVLILAIDILAEVCSQKTMEHDMGNVGMTDTNSEELRSVSPYLLKFTTSLLDMFRKEPSLMLDRGNAIIRQTCALLGPGHIFKSFALLLQSELDPEFISKMVQMLNLILNTTIECFELRGQLRHLATEESVDLFLSIYKCWAHQPISVLGLCLLSQNYKHAADLVKRLSHVDLTVDLLVEIDRLIQLIESPILSYVRLDLLSIEYQGPLASVLSALLMLIPQTEAFNILHKRLQLIPLLSATQNGEASTKRSIGKEIDFGSLLIHFDKVVGERQRCIRDNHRNMIRRTASK